MKRVCLVTVLMMLSLFQFIYAAGPLESKSISITVGAGARMFADEDFKDIYDTTPITYSADIAYRIYNSLELAAHTDYLKVDGLTTFTEEKTTLTIIPLEVGLRYNIALKKMKNQKIYPYLGAGAGYYMIKEETIFGNVDEKKIGFYLEGGLKLYVFGSLFVDAKVKNVILTWDNPDNINKKFNAGGFAVMGGLGYSF